MALTGGPTTVVTVTPREARTPSLQAFPPSLSFVASVRQEVPEQGVAVDVAIADPGADVDVTVTPPAGWLVNGFSSPFSVVAPARIFVRPIIGTREAGNYNDDFITLDADDPSVENLLIDLDLQVVDTFPFADDLIAAHEPWLTTDLETFLRAIASMFEDSERMNQAIEDGTILDPDLCPVEGLPYLAQFVGETLPVGIIEAAAREWIKDAPNRRRGTIKSIVRAAQRKLVGARTVTIFEREGGVKDVLGVVTYMTETPNEQAVRDELMTVVAADVVLNYRVLRGQTWADVAADGATWSDVAAEYDSWEEVSTAMPEGYTEQRPR
jgi:hypothetical protein